MTNRAQEHSKSVTLQQRFLLLALCLLAAAAALSLLLTTAAIGRPLGQKIFTLQEENRLFHLAQRAPLEPLSAEDQADIVEEVNPDDDRPAIPLGSERRLVSTKSLNLETIWSILPLPPARGLGALVFGFGLLYMLSTLLAARVTQPLSELLQAIRALRQDQLPMPIHPPRERELAELAQAFQDMAEELTARQRELQAALDQKRQLFAYVSHELKTPLTVLAGYLQMMQDQQMGELPESSLTALDIMQRNTRQLSTQVDELLLAARLDAGLAEPEPVTFDLDEFIEELAHEFRPLAEQRGLKLETKETGLEHLVTLDPNWCRQICCNLLTNALKYTEEGLVGIEVWREKNRLQVVVRDTGPGIDKVCADHLFQDFARGPNTENIPGHGLGLALSRRLAQLMGGDLHLEKASQGTTISWKIDPDYA